MLSIPFGKFADEKLAATFASLILSIPFGKFLPA